MSRKFIFLIVGVLIVTVAVLLRSNVVTKTAFADEPNRKEYVDTCYLWYDLNKGVESNLYEGDQDWFAIPNSEVKGTYLYQTTGRIDTYGMYYYSYEKKVSGYLWWAKYETVYVFIGTNDDSGEGLNTRKEVYNNGKRREDHLVGIRGYSSRVTGDYTFKAERK